jgi:hypothetical protein
LAAAGTGLAISSMRRHALAKRRDFFRKRDARFGSQALDPQFERAARGSEEPVPFVWLQLVGLRDW